MTRARRSTPWRVLKRGERSTNIQLNYCGIDLEPDQVIRYRFRAKATTPFTIENVCLMRARNPWGGYGRLLQRSADTFTDWQEHTVVFCVTVNAPVTDGRLSFFIGDVLSDGNESRKPLNLLRNSGPMGFLFLYLSFHTLKFR